MSPRTFGGAFSGFDVNQGFRSLHSLNPWLLSWQPERAAIHYFLQRGPHFPKSARSRFEQFDRIAVRIFQLDLFTARTYFHLIAKMKPVFLQLLDASRKIRNL